MPLPVGVSEPRNLSAAKSMFRPFFQVSFSESELEAGIRDVLRGAVVQRAVATTGGSPFASSTTAAVARANSKIDLEGVGGR